MGIVSCVGSQLDEAWGNILEGNSGIVPIDEFDASALATRIGGSVKGFDVSEVLSPKDARKMDPFMHYGIGASNKALADSGLEISEENGHRIGIAMGAGIGGLLTIENNHSKMLKGGPRRISPFFIPGSIINMISGQVSIIHGITGPNLSIVTCQKAIMALNVARTTRVVRTWSGRFICGSCYRRTSRQPLSSWL